MSPDGDLFPGFAAEFFDTGKVRLRFRIGGSGPPLLLLHGYPQTHASWHRVAGPLARSFTVAIPDLRGCGESSCPDEDLEHRAYSKRVMAGDMVLLMDRLGFRRFCVIGHGRGGRVAYRMALDRPECIARLAVADIVTTWDWWQPAQQAARNKGVQWAFLAQPAPIPESLIGADPMAWLDGCLKRLARSGSLDLFDPRALASYRSSFADPDRVHATCEDFRASACCDLKDDDVDRRFGRRIRCPTLVVWGTSGSLAMLDDPVALWRPWCETVAGCMVDSGHFIAEENPFGLLNAVLPFFKEAEACT